MSIHTYNITDDLIVEVYVDGNLVDWPGPWTDHDAADSWAQAMMAALDAGEFTYPTETP